MVGKIGNNLRLAEILWMLFSFSFFFVSKRLGNNMIWLSNKTHDSDLVMHATVALSGRHMGPTGLGPICQRLNVTVFTESPSLTHGSSKCNMHKKKYVRS